MHRKLKVDPQRETLTWLLAFNAPGFILMRSYMHLHLCGDVRRRGPSRLPRFTDGTLSPSFSLLLPLFPRLQN